MAQITATIEVPITVNWTQAGEPAGEQSATATAVVTREVDETEWGAVGNWSAGQATAAIQTGGSESGSGGGG